MAKQHMNYIGSKFKLLPFIEDAIKSEIGNISNKIFCDIFSGTGIVSKYFKSRVSSVISNDLEFYSYVFLRTYIGINYPINLEQEIDHLNNLIGTNGFIFENYSQNGTGNRLYFSGENGKKIDAIRMQIEQWKEDSTITEDQYYCLICSLIEASDKVANTTSVYGAHLKQFKSSASKPIRLIHPDIGNVSLAPIFGSSNQNAVYNMDCNKLIKQISGDILYLDPPYNSRQYSGNYHLLNTIAKYDTTFTPQGKTGQREDNNVSLYCSKTKVKKAFEDLITDSKFEYTFMSYNNEGIMSQEDVKTIMQKYGKYSLYTTEYGTFKADSNRNNKSSTTTEYLHVLKK